MSSIETVLISLAGLHHASDDLNLAELSSFSTEMLKAYPFIDAIIGLEKITDKEVGSFEHDMRRQGFIGLHLKYERMPGSFYLPVSFIEPMTPASVGMLGQDMRSLPNLLSVIDYTIATSNVSASEIFTSQYLKKPSVLMFKALYLGRYPPETEEERKKLLDRVVALSIDVEHFMSFLSLSEKQLIGEFSNSLVGNNKIKQKSIHFDMSSSSFIFTEEIGKYEKSYQLVLHRKLNLGMINKLQMFSLWLLSMLLFLFRIEFLKKRKASEDEIRYLAYYDTLTALPNRESFKDKLKLAISESQKHGTIGAILFIDIDEFKRINDTLGHNIGDELLKQVSKRLCFQMRHGDVESTFESNDRVIDLVTRLGGDEFTILLTDIENEGSAGSVAKRILEHISEPFHLKNHTVYVTSSIGIANFPDDGTEVGQLLKHADTAMYHAKSMGKNNYQFYLKKMSAQIEQRLILEGKLHHALEKNEFELFYQPQVDAQTNKIIGAEALIRWNQTELGMIFPDDFIPLAEETGQIIDIGEWVINEACRQNKEWQLAGYEPIRIAVNISGLQFVQDDLSLKIEEILKYHCLNPNYLELEITESVMMKNIDQTIATIKKLSSMSVGVSIDDFGTGYSSLSYLKRFPLEALKIDKSFVLDIPADNDDMMITSAIISLAKSLNLKVIAEGVEGKEQVDFLVQQHCDILQGYYFSRPVAAIEFEKLLNSRRVFDC